MAIIALKVEDKASANLSQVASRQIPFVVTKTLTDIAKQSQEQIRLHIKERFFIRKKSGGFESSIRIKPATKAKLQAEVYTMAAFAALQQTGGIKKGKDGRLAIPSYQNISQVKKRSGTNSPSSYLAGDAFKMRSKSGQEMIVKRMGKELKVLYFLRKNADVHKKLDMIETTQRAVRAGFSRQFQKNLSEVQSGKQNKS